MHGLVETAVAEISSPTLAMTEQLLSVHSVVKANGFPAVQHVEDNGADAHDVYFAVDDEPYFIAVHIAASSRGLVATSAFTVPRVRTHLVVTSDRLSPQQVSERLGIDSTSSGLKGQAPRLGAAVRRLHTWDFEPEKGTPGSLESKLGSILGHLEPHAESISQLASSGMAEVTLAICHEDYEGTLSGFVFSHDLIAGLTSLGCSVWFDPYVSGPELPE